MADPKSTLGAVQTLRTALHRDYASGRSSRLALSDAIYDFERLAEKLRDLGLLSPTPLEEE